MLDGIRARLTDLSAAFDMRTYAPVSAARPGLLRAANGMYTAYYLARRVKTFRQVHRTDSELFQPVGPARVLRKPLPPLVADAVYYAAMASNVAFTLGIKHRVVGPVNSTLMLWTLSYRNSWSMIFHNDNNLVLHTGVLGLTSSADAVAVGAPSTSPTPAWKYAVPVRLIQLVTATNYFLAGLAKVAGPLGWKWADGEVLRRQVAADGLRKELLGSKAAGLGIRLYRQTGLFKVMAVSSLVVELAAPVVLLDRRAAKVWAISAFGMHWGIFFIMGIRFRHNMSGVLYLPYFPIERALVYRG